MFLGKAVDDELGNQLVATMLYLDSENKKDINIYINCSGGEVQDSYPTSPCPPCALGLQSAPSWHACMSPGA